MQTQTAMNPAPKMTGNDDDREYIDYIARLGRRFSKLVEGGKSPLFQTDADDLWSIYLDQFEPGVMGHFEFAAKSPLIR